MRHNRRVRFLRHGVVVVCCCDCPSILLLPLGDVIGERRLRQGLEDPLGHNLPCNDTVGPNHPYVKPSP